MSFLVASEMFGLMVLSVLSCSFVILTVSKYDFISAVWAEVDGRIVLRLVEFW